MGLRRLYPPAVLLGVPIFLLIDSPYIAQFFENSQHFATVLVAFVFYKAYKDSPQRVRDVMVLGIFVGFAGEIFFSLILGMYHYRLDNVPLWLGFGHSLIFTSVYQIIRNVRIRQYEKELKKGLLAFAVAYSFFWLYVANDWFGFLCAIAFLVVLFTAKKSQLFFLIMFFIVCYIEQVGTAVGCWYWPTELLGKYAWMPSGNPPSGIAVFYFLFDATVLMLYLNIHRTVKYRRKRLLSM